MSKVKLTPDQIYMCRVMGTKLPLLPVHGETENKLFARMMAKWPSPLDFDAMALVWCDHVDGISILPKLPVYLRVHHTAWLRNTRIRETLSRMAVPLEQLRTRLAPHVLSPPAEVTPVGNGELSPSASSQAAASPAIAAASPGAASPVRVAQLPRVMPKPPVRAVAVAAVALEGGPQFVGGVRIGPSPKGEGGVEQEEPIRRKRGKRKKEGKQIRRCKRCVRNGGENAHECPGKSNKGEKACVHF